MIQQVALIPRNTHLSSKNAAANRCRTLGTIVALLLSGGCVEIRIPDPNVRYVAFGDSTTSGPSTRDYSDILQSLLEAAPETITNEGVGGETSEDGLDRLRSLIANKIYPNAEVLLYWEGGNDVTGFIKDNDPFLLASPDDPDYAFTDDLTQRLAETQANIESAVAAAQNAGWRVHVATYFFLRENITECGALPLPVILPGQARNANVYINRLNDRIRTAAANQNAALVDVAASDDALRLDPANYFDCDHLSEQGNGIVANLFFQALTKPTN